MNEKTENPAEKKIMLPDPEKLVISSSPHLHADSSVRKIMLQVLLCLLPCVIASLWFFRWDALFVMGFCTAFSMIFEYLWTKLFALGNTVSDGSAAVTGMLLAMTLPSGAPWWICLIGSFFAIIIGKEVFGGLGQNPFNPAAVGRIALLIGFAGPMTSWSAPAGGTISGLPDAMTHATPLCLMNSFSGNAEAMGTLDNVLHNCFWGRTGGCIGETCVPAILLGLAGLLAFRLIRWQIPFAIIGTTALFTWLVHLAAPAVTPGPAFHLMTGGLLIGAVFMATDMVTSPVTASGSLIFGAGIAVITCVIRIWGNYPEGMSFAILIMNALVPLIDKLCFKRPFGWIQERRLR